MPNMVLCESLSNDVCGAGGMSLQVGRFEGRREEGGQGGRPTSIVFRSEGCVNLCVRGKRGVGGQFAC
eukprot:5879325-Prorocentrum_lima.AAC.1